LNGKNKKRLSNESKKMNNIHNKRKQKPKKKSIWVPNPPELVSLIIGAFLGAVFGYIFTIDASEREAKDDYESLLESSIYNTEMAIASVEWLMSQAEKNAKPYNLLTIENKEVPNVYEPYSIKTITNLLIEEKDTYDYLSEASKRFLPEIVMNITGAKAYYDFENNKYINYLALKHIYNNLVWQLEHLKLEREYFSNPDAYESQLDEEELESLYTEVIKYLIVEDKKSCSKISNYDEVLKEDRFIVKRIQYAMAFQAIEDEWKMYEEGKLKDLNKKEQKKLIQKKYRHFYDSDNLTDEDLENFFVDCF
jgi:hypothetical protein